METWTLCTLTVCCFEIFGLVGARPMKNPDFESIWYDIVSNKLGQNRIDVHHYLSEVPVRVQVQVMCPDGANRGFIFPAIGIKPRDDDTDDPYSGIVYLYNHEKVTISALVMSNSQFNGRTIYTEQSNGWEGPNSQDTYSAKVRVRAWKESSFPKPDFHSVGTPVNAGCQIANDCFFERVHGLNEYPSEAIVRTKLDNPGTEFHGFMSDGVGASLMVYVGGGYRRNGYLIYGFSKEHFRIWLDSSNYGDIFNGDDGSAFAGSTYVRGELEIFAWKTSSLTPSDSSVLQLGAIPGSEFESEKRIDVSADTEEIVLNIWVETLSGDNKGYRFPGSGSLSNSLTQTAKPCSFGGLVYGYTNLTVRIWKPATDAYGNLICIADMFGGGINSQASNDGQAVVHTWIPKVSNLRESCAITSDCLDSNTVCQNQTCSCQEGYHISDEKCEKVLTCADNVPTIPELERRGRNYIIDAYSESEKFINDAYIKASWYSSINYRGQYLMPDSLTPPKDSTCGTMYPIYVKETHPGIESLTEEPTNLETCAKNCTETFIIEVRKCNGSIQYNIAPTSSNSCAFCFDPPALQGVQEFDDAPEVELGSLLVKTDLQYNRSQIKNTAYVHWSPYLMFSCAMDTTHYLSTNLFYTTYWFIDSKLLFAYGPLQKLQPLLEDELLDNGIGLGIRIKCGIRVSRSPTGLMTQTRFSTDFFAGIKVHNVSIIIEKGKNAILYLEPTVPIGCKYSNMSTSKELPCFQSLDMMYPRDSRCTSDIISVARTPRCGSHLKALKKNETWEAGKIYTFEITTQDNNFADGLIFKLQLQTQDGQHTIWNKYQIEDITVIVTFSTKSRFKLCYSHVDPHMQTADGITYDHQYPGEFILYRNTEYEIEVQEKTTICNAGRAFCACAIAIRAGADVFLINTCGGLKYIGFTSCGDNGILDVRKRADLRYQVYTPIGTYMDIQLRPYPGYNNLMNIDIYMAPKDLNRTEGLCGYFDGDNKNDFMKRDKKTNLKMNDLKTFSDEWRIKNSERNFLTMSPPFVPTWQMEDQNLFCVCEQAQRGYSGTNSTSSLCSPSLYLNCTRGELSVTRKLCDSSRIKRAASYVNFKKELERRSLLVDEEYVVRKQKRNADEKQVTKEQAMQHCTSIINGHAAVTEFPERLQGFDAINAIDECAFDVSEGNDMSWANIYPDIMNHVIETNNERDPVYVESHASEVARFKLQSCPLNCNGNGNCSVDGKCVCSHGFHGSDCSIDEADELTIDDIQGGGLCDVKEGDKCDCFGFQTLNLLEMFYCRVTEKKNLVDGAEEAMTPLLIAGGYEDIFNGLCCLPKTRRKRSAPSRKDVFTTQYDIAVSNDGLHYGKARSVYLFDSTCQQLRQNVYGLTVFSLKDRWCYINNRCIIENDTLLNDDCNTCFPSVNMYNWTDRCVTDYAEHTTSIGMLLPLGICGGVAAFIVVIVIICTIQQKILKPRKAISDSAIFDTIRGETAQKNPRPSRMVIESYKE